MPASLEHLRRFAAARSLFGPTTLARALATFGFVQADPIRAPARAQDLTLRHRVADYRAGDLERRYGALAVEEDVFINYGFVTDRVRRLMHPRRGSWTPAQRRRVDAVLAFVRDRGEVHPRDVDREFAHGRVTNYWGGTSSATTHLLDLMQYRGLVRVARREAGIRIYAVQEPAEDAADRAERSRRIDALVDIVVGKYAPLPHSSLSMVVARLRYAVPQWRRELKAAVRRAQARLRHETVDGVAWYWPADEPLPSGDAPDVVRLLAPFDPIVWDRRRFEMLWGWPYRFEAYTPIAKRSRGYYALPLLWRDNVIGWGNVSVAGGALHADLGYAGSPPRDRAFRRALDDELDRLRTFLDCA
ncbi:MAG TPA: crosslink repair DNA glycosylase YcaQ family protein [Vicinamibacterales bacterium]|nr:crosslink repair DNA glycosylase YcaQ family protein [Vicinamibacterales bacterium]